MMTRLKETGMNFNSLSYFTFLPVTLFIYFLFPAKWRNPVLLVLSYLFYMSWNPKYALLILASTIITYVCALLMQKRALNRRRLWLALSFTSNLLILFFFKYFNFLSGLITRALYFLHIPASMPVLDVLLPVGISFYTFQVLGYMMDAYRGEIKTERNFIDYALFVSFFPQLVAGPIERANNLLPQMKTIHRFNMQNVFEGSMLFLWGLFKKMVIADRLAVMVDYAFSAAFGKVSGFQYAIAAAAFSIQIYCDFSAYSDIARGSARMLGFELMRNFDAPYLADSIKAFWRRWHISLSTWFKDYLYFPLGGSRCAKKYRVHVNLMIVFMVSGLWHGAALTFLVWGFLHGLFQVVSVLTKKPRARFLAVLRIPETNRLLKICRILFNFALVAVAFVFFRAASLRQALYILKTIALTPFAAVFPIEITQMGLSVPYLIVLLVAITALFIADAAARHTDIIKNFTKGLMPKYIIYLMLLVIILLFGYYGSGYDPQDFIYFRF